MKENKLNSSLCRIKNLCFLLIFKALFYSIGALIVLILCISFLPFFFFEIMFGNSEIFQEYHTITMNFNEQRAINS